MGVSKAYAKTGPGTLAGQYLRRYWQPVAKSADLAPGQAKRVTVMSEDLTLYRGVGGMAYAVANRCAHRGEQLSLGWVEDDCIRCYYHGWSYDATGQCVDQPAEGPAMAAKVRIRAYPTCESLGLVFAFIGEGQPPAFPSCPGFDDFEGPLLADSYVRHCNYFQSFENAVDIVHTGFVHRGSHEHVGDELPTLSCHESTAGLTLIGKLSNSKALVNQLGMPNRFHMNFPAPPDIGWQGVTMWWVPIDDHSHTLYSVYRIPGDPAVAAGYLRARAESAASWDLSHAELAEHIVAGKTQMVDVETKRINLIRLQDDLSQIGQGRIADRDHERLGRSDVAVILLRRLWSRELGFVARDDQLTEWSSPTALPVRFYEAIDESELDQLARTGARS
jgi:5,5'-dehydrodivanillate O-demethylase